MKQFSQLSMPLNYDKIVINVINYNNNDIGLSTNRYKISTRFNKSNRLGLYKTNFIMSTLIRASLRAFLSKYTILVLIHYYIIVFLLSKNVVYSTSLGVACDQNNFMLMLNFDTPFHGIIYSEESFPNCVYVNGSMLPRSFYHLNIPLVGCDTRINEEGNYENAIIVQENNAFLQGSDKKYLLTCIPINPLTATKAPTTTSSIMTTAISVTLTSSKFFEFEDRTTELRDSTGNNNKKSMRNKEMSMDEKKIATFDENDSHDENVVRQEKTESEKYLPPKTDPDTEEMSVKYSVEIRNGHTLDAPPLRTALNIGDPIFHKNGHKIWTRLDPILLNELIGANLNLAQNIKSYTREIRSYMVRLQKPIANSQVGRCWANDAYSNLELSDERGCTLQPRGHIWNAFERADTDREVIFINRIKAWAFPTSNEVNIFCNLRICMSRVCSFGNCTAAPLSTKAIQKKLDEKIHEEDGDGDITTQQIAYSHSYLPHNNDAEERLSNFQKDKIESFHYNRAARALLTARTVHGVQILSDAVANLELLNYSNESSSPTYLKTKMKEGIHFDGQVGELTEIETLSTNLRFRRQSIQERKQFSNGISGLITENDSEQYETNVATNTKKYRTDSLNSKNFDENQYGTSDFEPIIHPNFNRKMDEINEISQFYELDDPRSSNKTMNSTFSPKIWRIVAIIVFHVLAIGGLVAFFAWRSKLIQLVRLIR